MRKEWTKISNQCYKEQLAYSKVNKSADIFLWKADKKILKCPTLYNQSYVLILGDNCVGYSILTYICYMISIYKSVSFPMSHHVPLTMHCG